jgi:quinol monooxygenase YgiN
VIVVRFKVRCQPDKAAQVEAAFQQVIAPAREVEGVINFDIARDLSDPSCFIATEVFEDRAALDRQESIPEVANVMSILPDSLAGPPEATIYNVSSAEPHG